MTMKNVSITNTVPFSSSVITGFVLSLALTTLADAVTVAPIGWRETGGIAVPESQTKTVEKPLVVGDRATFLKTGPGTLEVPAAAFDRTASNPSYAVLGGTLKITDAAVTPEADTAPACCSNAAAVWFSAADTSRITGAADDIQKWYDVRETDTETPTRPYMTHTLGNNFTESPESKQSLTTAWGRNAVYFGGSAAETAGGYMHLQTPAGTDDELKMVRTVFFVHAVSNVMGTVFGATSDPSDFFVGASLRDLDSIGYLYYRGDSIPGSFTGRAYRNGDAFDLFHEKITRRVEVIAMDFTERPGHFATFFNQRGRTCVSGRCGGDYLSEFIAFTNRLTEAEILAVNRYLMQKWNLEANTRKPVRLEIAEGAAAEFAPTYDMAYTNYYPFVFAGEGTVRQTGAQSLSFPGEAFKDFRGTLELPSGKTVVTRYDELPPVVPEGGRAYTASLDNRTVYGVSGSLRVAATTEGAATAVTKKGDGELVVAADRVPSGVKTLSVEAGTLTLRGEATNSFYAAVTAATGFNAVFANPTAELTQYDGGPYSLETDRRLVLGRSTNPWTLDGWTRPDPSAGTSGYLVVPDLSSWYNGIPEGNQAIFLLSSASNTVSEIYTTVTFPTAGEYLMSWRETRNLGRYACGAIGYNLKFGKAEDGWANASVIAKRTAATGQFPRIYQRVTVSEAGEYIFGFQIDSYHYYETAIAYQGLVVDDFRGDLLVQAKSAAKVFLIPNGDFEETYTSDGIHGGQDISVLNATTVAANWVFNQGANWPKEGDVDEKPAVGVAGYAFPQHHAMTYSSGSNPSQSLFGRNSDVKEGSHMLFLCQGETVGLGSYAETTFTVPKAGTYLLRGKVSRWNITYLDCDFLGNVKPETGRPYVRAQVTVGGNTTILGDLPCDRHVQADRVWTNAFTVAADNTSVTLRIAETLEKFGAIVDDLVLVRVEEPSFDDGVEKFLLNGSFEEGVTIEYRGYVNGDPVFWTKVAGKKNDGSAGNAPDFFCNLGSTGQQYVRSAYDGDVVCNIRGTSEITQQVTTLTPGRYRFRMAANSRFTTGYDKNGLVVALYDVTKTELKKTIFTTDAVTSFNPHVYETEFDLEEGGAFTFSVKGNPTDLATAKDGEQDNRCTAIDGLSLRKISQTPMATPALAEDLRVEVAVGAKLKLDFDGAVKVDAVKLGATRVSGEISAVTFPAFIEGSGSLTVTPKGTIVIFL